MPCQFHTPYVLSASSLGSFLTYQAVAVETNEGGQLTERLARHAQQAPVLDAWLAKFPTLRQGLPAQHSLAEVSTAVDGVAGRILASKAAVAAIKVSIRLSSCVMQCSSDPLSRWPTLFQSFSHCLLEQVSQLVGLCVLAGQHAHVAKRLCDKRQKQDVTMTWLYKMR